MPNVPDLTDSEIKIVLAHNPFEGDSDTRVRYINNKMVRPYKDSLCHCCKQVIPRRTQARSITAVFEGQELGSYKICMSCCKAILEDSRDCGERLNDRSR